MHKLVNPEAASTQPTAAEASCLSVGERRVEIGVGRAMLVAMGLEESMCRYTSAHFLSRDSVRSAEFFIVEQAPAVLPFEPRIIEHICFGEVRLPYVSQQFRFGMCAKPTEIASQRRGSRWHRLERVSSAQPVLDISCDAHVGTSNL